MMKFEWELCKRTIKGHHSKKGRKIIKFGLIALLAMVLGAFYPFSGLKFANAASPCTESADATLEACNSEAQDDYWIAIAKCHNLPTVEEREACMDQARQAEEEATEECEAQHQARLEVCEELGGDAYHPVIDPGDFGIDTLFYLFGLKYKNIDNAYSPLTPGTTRIYEGQTEEGTEVIEVQVTDDIREILGVPCLVVRDTVTVDDELVEDTYDYFAQDKEGNVWYFGENSYTYEDGKIVSVDGSWIAGVDGAKPGIVMEAHPEVSDVYRQEFAPGEAEDLGEVLSLNQSVTVPYGSFGSCLMTKDFSPIEPDVEEHKYYAPGVGVVLELNVETGERVELVDVITASEPEEQPEE